MKRGRPQKPIDLDLLAEYAKKQVSKETAAAALGIDRHTLTNTHGELWDHYKALGQVALFGKQFDMAMDGNVTMLVWLGKQHLNQTDVRRNELTGADGGPIEVSDADRKRAEDDVANAIAEAESITRNATS